ncbi:MAG: Hint domain-containing protein [Paracoccaceae bacterium]|nr:Hint domain-containing protein [Paracoccaceae bacterium]
MAQTLQICEPKDAQHPPRALCGLTAGTPVLTLAGVMPVEFLTPGDRIITRNGARPLRAIRVEVVTSARMIRVCASAIGIDQPQDDILIRPDQQILIRDWRAKALMGAGQAVVAAAKLIDGEYIFAQTVTNQTIVTLEFDAPVVLYAGGLELASTQAPVLA